MTEYRIDRVLMGRLPPGTDLLEGIVALCVRERVQCAHLSLLGALTHSALGWYEPEGRCYHRFEVDGIAEILHGSGNISLLDGQPFPHVHLTLSQGEQRTFGGHLMPGSLIFVAEVQLLCYVGPPLQRELDPVTGLKLWPVG